MQTRSIVHTLATMRVVCLPLLLAACTQFAPVPPATAPGPQAGLDAPPGARQAAVPGRLAQGAADCGPCCNANPAALASATQGVSAAHPDNPYVGKDTYDNVIIGEGTVFYALHPGQPGFAVAERTLRDAGGSRDNYYALVQVTTDPGKDAAGRPRTLRDRVQAYRVREPLCAARGTASANPQFGSGGGIQYYVAPSDSARLVPGKITPISDWRADGPAE